MAKVCFGLLLISLFAFAGTAPAAEPQPPKQDVPSELLKEGTQQILRAFELFLQAIPQYEAPEILSNGDILIRRVHPNRPPHHPKKPPGGETTDKT